MEAMDRAAHRAVAGAPMVLMGVAATPFRAIRAAEAGVPAAVVGDRAVVAGAQAAEAGAAVITPPRAIRRRPQPRRLRALRWLRVSRLLRLRLAVLRARPTTKTPVICW